MDCVDLEDFPEVRGPLLFSHAQLILVLAYRQ
jgi:hypothetical protein